MLLNAPIYIYKHVFIGLFLLAISANSSGFGYSHHQDEKYIDIQSGSLLGLGHVSYGSEYNNRHSVLAGVGYVPSLSNHKEMMLYSLRYRYDFSKRWNINDMTFNPFSLGLGLLMSDHDDLFLELPTQYPDGYYAPSALRIIFNYQAILQVKPHFQVYLDISVLDVGFISYIREPEFFYDNYDFLGLEGVTNWGFGVRYGF